MLRSPSESQTLDLKGACRLAGFSWHPTTVRRDRFGGRTAARWHRRRRLGNRTWHGKRVLAAVVRDCECNLARAGLLGDIEDSDHIAEDHLGVTVEYYQLVARFAEGLTERPAELGLGHHLLVDVNLVIGAVRHGDAAWILI